VKDNDDDDDVEMETSWGGVRVPVEEDIKGKEEIDTDPSAGVAVGSRGGLEVLASEGDAGVYRSPRSGKVQYLKSLRCLRDEVQGELDGRREMLEELGWLSGAVV